MLFRVYLNLRPERGISFLTGGGDLVHFSHTLFRELEKSNADPKGVAEAISLFAKERGGVFSTYVRPIKPRSSTEVLTRVLEAEMVNGGIGQAIYLVISDFGRIAEAVIASSRAVGEVIERIVRSMKRLNLMRISMPIPYKFLVFETFNRFTKEFQPSYRGYLRIGEYENMISVTDDMRALMWPLEQTFMEYSAQIDDQTKRVLADFIRAQSDF